MSKLTQPENPTVIALLKEAKRLHRAALSQSNMRALPVLRRLKSAEVIRGLSLLELRKTQGLIQRKHLLQLLASEAGFSSWANYKHALEHPALDSIEHFSLPMKQIGYPNLWFSNRAEADQYAHSQGGRAISVGHQAVVIPVSSTR